MNIFERCKEHSHSISFIAAMAVYIVSLDIIYKAYIVAEYSQRGFRDEASLSRIVVSIFILTACFIYLDRMKCDHRLSVIVINYLLVAVFIPGVIVYSHMGTPFFYQITIYYIVLLAFVIGIPSFHVKLVSWYSDIGMNMLGMFLGAVILYAWIEYARCHIQTDLIYVYEQRFLSSDYEMPRVLQYVIGMAPSCIPIISVYNFAKKKYAMAILFIAVQYIQFCIYATKSSYFLMIGAYVLYFISRKPHEFFGFSIILMTLCVIIAIMAWFCFGDRLVIDVIRRVFFDSQILNYDYYSFFQENPYDYFRSSLLKKFLVSPYKGVGIARSIGIYNGTQNAPNNGLYSDAYSNLGFCGVFIMPILIGVFLKVLDLITANKDIRCYYPAVLVIVMTLTSSAFFTGLISHGLLLVAFVLFLMPDKTVLKDQEGISCHFLG